jgi:hypothetical protein
MNRLQTAVVLSMFTVASTATAQTSQRIKPEDVKLTSDADDVEFCKMLGKVGGGFRRVDKGAAAIGANVVLWTIYTSGEEQHANGGTAYFCTAEDVGRQAMKQAALQESANRKIACTAGADCEFKWSRVTLWLANNSKWKFRSITDTLISTEGPLDTLNNPAFEVIKIATGDGKTYQISMRPSCGKGCSEKLFMRLRANFADFVLAPPETK